MHHESRSRSRHGSRNQSGFTLVEVMVTLMVLVLSILGIGSTVAQVHKLRGEAREKRIAHNALRAMKAHVLAISEEGKLDPDTWGQHLVDTFSEGGIPGPNIPVAGLKAIDGEPSVCRVVVIVDERLSDEDIGADFGMPRDLDGDGWATNTNIVTTTGIFPVLISMRWSGAGGERRARLPMFITRF